MLIKAESSARLEYTPYLGDNDHWIEILAKEHRAHDDIEFLISILQVCRVTLLKAQLYAVLSRICCSGT